MKDSDLSKLSVTEPTEPSRKPSPTKLPVWYPMPTSTEPTLPKSCVWEHCRQTIRAQQIEVDSEYWRVYYNGAPELGVYDRDDVEKKVKELHDRAKVSGKNQCVDVPNWDEEPDRIEFQWMRGGNVTRAWFNGGRWYCDGVQVDDVANEVEQEINLF